MIKMKKVEKRWITRVGKEKKVFNKDMDMTYDVDLYPLLQPSATRLMTNRQNDGWME
jgi:hypothetical protein